MIPVVEVAGSSRVPERAAFWTPKRSELEEEGFGWFRDTWTILDVPVAEARSVVAVEREIVDAIDALAEDDTHFERLADAVEQRREPDDDTADLQPAERELLERYGAVDDFSPLDGLEVGVAGLVHALATVRILPAASCRSHGPSGWAPSPAVFFVSNEFRAHALSVLAEQAGCVLTIDQARPELLVVAAPSIRHMMALAAAVLDNRSSFKQPRKAASKRRASKGRQLELNLRQV